MTKIEKSHNNAVSALFLFFLQILRFGSKRPHHPFERRVFILLQNLPEVTLFLDTPR